MPNRIIKESICTSENLDNLTPEEEVFFYRLVVNCDDYGRADARPQVLRAKCFPIRMDRISNSDIDRWLRSLAREKLITIYYVEGKPYLQFVTWGKHQQIRAKKSKFPAPDSAGVNLISDDINCKQMSPYSYSYSKSNSEAESETKSETITEKTISAAGLIKFFEKDFGRPLGSTESEQVIKWLEKNEPDVIKEALRRAVLNGKYNFKYIDRILLSWEKANKRTLREVLEYEAAIEKQRAKKSPPAEDAAKVVQISDKRREETIRSACEYIRLQCGPDPPREKAEDIAKGYGAELVPAIIERLYGGLSP